MPEIELTPADQGRTVDVRAGDVLIVRLPENPTTGYRWELDPAGGGSVAVDGSEFRPGAADGTPPAAGAAGTRVVRLRAGQAAGGPVRLVLRRPWGSGDPADRFEFVARASG